MTCIPIRLLQELLEIEKDRRAFIVMKCLVHCLVLQLSSFPSLCKNQLFSGFDKCRSQTPVTSSMAVGAWECCKSKSNSLHFISPHTARNFWHQARKKKTLFIVNAVYVGSSWGQWDNERRETGSDLLIISSLCCSVLFFLIVCNSEVWVKSDRGEPGIAIREETLLLLSAIHSKIIQFLRLLNRPCLAPINAERSRHCSPWLNYSSINQ